MQRHRSIVKVSESNALNFKHRLEFYPAQFVVNRLGHRSPSRVWWSISLCRGASHGPRIGDVSRRFAPIWSLVCQHHAAVRGLHQSGVKPYSQSVLYHFGFDPVSTKYSRPMKFYQKKHWVMPFKQLKVLSCWATDKRDCDVTSDTMEIYSKYTEKSTMPYSGKLARLRREIQVHALYQVYWKCQLGRSRYVI